MGSIKNVSDVENNNNSNDKKEIFVDREPQRVSFNQSIGAIGEGSQLLYYAGAGGVGKTALIRELEKYVNSDSSKSLNFKSVSYDFTFGTEMLTVLNALKKFLTDNYKVEFPFFEKACLSYYKKCGDEAGKTQIENILKESTLLNQGKRKLETLTNQSYNARNVDKCTGGTIEELGYIAEGVWAFRLLKVALDTLDDHITEIQNSRREYDSTYRKIAEELKEREKHIFPEAIKEYLPELFAKDISVWLEKNQKYMVIFLDTYEQLTEDEKGVKRHEKLIYENKDVPVDWWIEDLLSNTKRVAWVIAGRGKIEKIGAKITLEAENNIFQLESLGNDFIDEFLTEAKITDETLRTEIKDLTGGYPIYLNVCVDTYREIIANGDIPELENFKGKCETVVSRLLDYMDANARLMISKLCILGIWTDDLAGKLLAKLKSDDLFTYDRLKKLSFVTADKWNGKNLFVFDKSIRQILLDYFKNTSSFSEFIPNTCAAIDEIFNEIFSNQNKENLELYFKIWCNVILTTSTSANELMTRYEKNFAHLNIDLSNAVLENAISDFQDAVKKFGNQDTIKIPYAYFDHLLAQTKFLQGDDSYLRDAAKIAYEKIANSTDISNLKNYLTAGQYSMAFFHAMATDKNTDEYKKFSDNFKTSIKEMFYAEKEIVLNHFYFILKSLLNVYRNNQETLNIIYNAMNFISGDNKWLGKSLNNFVLNLKLYRLTALSHLGKLEEFKKIAETDCISALENAIDKKENLELHLIYANRVVVYLKEILDYDKSLELGNEVLALIRDVLDEKDPNFETYKDQYARICGSLAQTCYFSMEHLKEARNFTDDAINKFDKTDDKKRQYQIRAHIEAETENFETACEMLGRGLNISFENPTAEQFKNFSAFDWYHFAKFSERLLKSNDEKYFEIAKCAIEISRQEFLNYCIKIIDATEYPDYITFSKMATCFYIVGDYELSLELNEEALRSVDSDSGDDAAAFRLIMLVNYLLTLEKNNHAKKSEVTQKLKNYLDEYFTKVNIDSMKVPFDSWQVLIDGVEKNSADKLELLEKMSRAILL